MTFGLSHVRFVPADNRLLLSTLTVCISGVAKENILKCGTCGTIVSSVINYIIFDL